jgi:hypothetical protein
MAEVQKHITVYPSQCTLFNVYIYIYICISVRFCAVMKTYVSLPQFNSDYICVEKFA